MLASCCPCKPDAERKRRNLLFHCGHSLGLNENASGGGILYDVATGVATDVAMFDAHGLAEVSAGSAGLIIHAVQHVVSWIPLLTPCVMWVVSGTSEIDKPTQKALAFPDFILEVTKAD